MKNKKKIGKRLREQIKKPKKNLYFGKSDPAEIFKDGTWSKFKAQFGDSK